MNRRLTIKLGSQCNWNCSHCHNEPVNYPYNPRLIEWIKSSDIKRITFSGGEPLIYWNTIVKICRALGKNYKYRVITNGSLLDRSKIAFLSSWGFSVIVSYDGEAGQRSNDPPTNWLMLEALKDISFSTVVYKKNLNLPKIQAELLDKCKEFNLARPKLSLQPEFIHQTAAVDDGTNNETAKEYCRQMARIIEPEILSLINTPEENRLASMINYHTTRKALGKWYVPKPPTAGTRCFNEEVLCVSLDGRFLLCPYNDKRVVGDVTTGVDWEKVSALRPAKCLKCGIFNICRCSCLANVTDNECYIARTMNRWLNKVIDRYQCKDLLLELWRKANDYSFSQTAFSRESQ